MTAGKLQKDTEGFRFQGPFDASTGNGKAWRGANVSGDYADGQVVLFDALGAALLVAANPGVVNVAQLGGSAVSLGQQAMASSIPVAVASNQLDVPVSGPLTDVQLRATSVPVSTELPAAAPLADGQANPTTPTAGAAQELFNGLTWDRERGNTEVTVFASAARTATEDSADQTNHNARGLHAVIDVTAIVDTPSVVFKIQAKDPLSGQYYDLLESAAIVAVGTTVLKVYPGLTAAANTVANDVLPRTWRVRAEHADADSITYSVGALLVN